MARTGTSVTLVYALSVTDQQENSAPRRVVVAEDESLIRLDIVEILRDNGFEVVGEAGDGETAVALATELRPDLVVMDVRLAGPRDGVEAAIHIYKHFGVRAMFATAHSDQQTIARGQEANPLRWVAKPYSPAGLVAEIRAHFEG